MMENIFNKLDIAPGNKTYWLAAIAAVLFWGNTVGFIPTDIYDTLLPWILGGMAPTVAMKLMRR